MSPAYTASWLVVPKVIVFPVSPACWTSFLAAAMFWVSTGELAYAWANMDVP